MRKSFQLGLYLMLVMLLAAPFVLQANATQFFADGFESGDFSAWTSTTTSGSGTATVVTTQKNSGTYSARLYAPSNDADCALCYKALSTSITSTFVRFYVYISTFPTSGTTMIPIAYIMGIGGWLPWFLYLDSTNRNLQLRSYDNSQTVTTSTSSTTLNLTTWYCIEVKWVRDNSNGEYRVYLNGIEVADLTRTGVATGNMGSMSDLRLGILNIGRYYSSTVELYIDDVVVADAYIGPEAPARYLTVISPFGTPGGQGWYENGSTAYATLDVGIVDHGNGTRRVFTGWTGDASGSNFSQSDAITMNDNKTAIAIWATQYYVTFTHSGLDSSASGTVITVNGTPVNYGELPYSFWIDSDSIITYSYNNLSSTATGKRFILTGSTDPASPMTITENTVVTGDYTVQYLLTVTTTPPALTPQPSRNPPGEYKPPNPNSWWYDASATVTLTAQTVTGYQFVSWTVDDISQGSDVNPTNVIMNSLHSAVANYIQETPISVSIDPKDSTITLGHSVPFTSTVIGGTSPYTHQWYVDGNPVSGATSNTWAFTPAAPGVHYVYLRVTDSSNNTASSPTARVTVSTTPVGGYSIRVLARSTVQPTEAYGALICLFGAVLAALRRKRNQTSIF